jgi:hypothetical protein
MFNSPVAVHQQLDQASGATCCPMGRLMRFVAGAVFVAAAFLTGFQLVSSPGQLAIAIAAFLVSALAYTALTWLVGDQLLSGSAPG